MEAAEVADAMSGSAIHVRRMMHALHPEWGGRQHGHEMRRILRLIRTMHALVYTAAKHGADIQFSRA